MYLAGVEAAELKKLRREYYTFEGVSQNSPVQNYRNEYLKDFGTRKVTEEKRDDIYRNFFQIQNKIAFMR